MTNSSVTITRRLDTVVDDLDQEFVGLYCEQDFRKVIADLKIARGGYWHQNAAVLLDMLHDCGIECKRGDDFDTEYYEKYIDKLVADRRIMTKDQLGDKLTSMCRQLAGNYMKYPSPKDYIRRLVDRLSKEEDAGWKDNPLRLRILKQFIKYGDYAGYVFDKYRKGAIPGIDKPHERDASKIESYIRNKLSIKGKGPLPVEVVLENIADDVFEIVDNCELLRTCESLASGRFHIKESTKRDLYLFAIVYEMTFYSHLHPTSVKQEDRDIENHLFRDYYSTNLIQYLLQHNSEDNVPDIREEKKTPHGKRESIAVLDPHNCLPNYKNFAEVIYLYCICKEEESPADKIRMAQRLIHTVKNTEMDAPVPELPQHQDSRTIYMRNLVKGSEESSSHKYVEDIMEYSEKELIAFIRANLDCRVKNLSPFMIEAESQTAIREFDSIVNKLEKKYPKNRFQHGELTRYGLFFDEVRLSKDGMNEQTEAVVEEDHFSIILKAADNLIRNWLQKEEDINRTKLLAAFYYAYNDEHVNDNSESVDLASCKGRSFRSHYEQFRQEVNKLFDHVNFAPFSSKNLLDMLVVCSSYIYIYG